jgi:hypothetical protein
MCPGEARNESHKEPRVGIALNHGGKVSHQEPPADQELSLRWAPDANS